MERGRDVGSSDTENPCATLRAGNADLKSVGLHQRLRTCFQKWPLAAACRLDGRGARKPCWGLRWNAGEKPRGLSSQLTAAVARKGLTRDVQLIFR